MKRHYYSRNEGRRVRPATKTDKERRGGETGEKGVRNRKCCVSNKR